MRADNLTFEEMSDQLLALVLRTSQGSTRVDLVFDIYKPLSIKQTERTLRGSELGIRCTNIVPGHKIQQWQRLLACGDSKMKMISFIFEQWQQPQRRQQLLERTEGSIAGIRSYNRGVRLCKLVYEALLRLAWKRFYFWLETNHIEYIPQLKHTPQFFAILRSH
jgi:hypothetical protein